MVLEIDRRAVINAYSVLPTLIHMIALPVVLHIHVRLF